MREPNLSRKLALQIRQSSPDGMGGFAHDWVTQGSLWAELTARSGTEKIVSERAASRQAWRITVRGAPVGSPQRPTAAMRFAEGGRVFNILAVAEADPAGRYLVCTAEEGLHT